MSLTKAIKIYVCPVVLAVGIIGNGLSFVVMTRKSLRGQVTSFYLALLAVFDTLALTVGITSNWYHDGLEMSALSEATCKIVIFIDYWFTDAVNWIVSLIALDRLVNIIFPQKAKTWITLKRSVWLSVSVILFLFVINFQLLFIMRIQEKSYENKTYVGCGFTSVQAHTIFSWIDLACFCVIPFTVISSCNAAVIIRLYLVKSRSTEQRMTSITLKLILVSLIPLVCTTPFEVYQLSGRDITEAEHLYAISHLLIFVSNSINFFVYCIVGESFRNELRKLFCRNQVAAAPADGLMDERV